MLNHWLAGPACTWKLHRGFSSHQLSYMQLWGSLMHPCPSRPPLMYKLSHVLQQNHRGDYSSCQAAACILINGHMTGTEACHKQIVMGHLRSTWRHRIRPGHQGLKIDRLQQFCHAFLLEETTSHKAILLNCACRMVRHAGCKEGLQNTHVHQTRHPRATQHSCNVPE